MASFVGVATLMSCQKDSIKEEDSNTLKTIVSSDKEIFIPAVRIRLAGPRCAKFGLGCRKPKGDNVDWYADPIVNNSGISINYISKNIVFVIDQNENNLSESNFEVEEISMNEILELNGLSKIEKNVVLKTGVYKVDYENGIGKVTVPIK